MLTNIPPCRLVPFAPSQIQSGYEMHSVFKKSPFEYHIILGLLKKSRYSLFQKHKYLYTPIIIVRNLPSKIPFLLNFTAWLMISSVFLFEKFTDCFS